MAYARAWFEMPFVLLLLSYAHGLRADAPYVTAGEVMGARAQRLSNAELRAHLVPGSVSEFMSLDPQVG